MGIRRVMVSNSLLCQVLATGNTIERIVEVASGLPQDARFVSARAAWLTSSPDLELVFESDEWPQDRDGGILDI